MKTAFNRPASHKPLDPHKHFTVIATEKTAFFNGSGRFIGQNIAKKIRSLGYKVPTNSQPIKPTHYSTTSLLLPLIRH